MMTVIVNRFRTGSVALSWIAVLALGCVEAMFGRSEYLGDWISYLNVSRAVSALDWHEIFNPMWGPGYPILIAIARSFAPPTPEGEWYAINVLNVAIFLIAYAAWRFLIRSAIAFYRPAAAEVADQPVSVWASFFLFMGCALGIQRVSAASPDLLVMTFFILATALTLRVIKRRTIWDAVALGLLLGTGVWIKGVFTPFCGTFLLMIFIDCCVKRSGWRSFCVVAAIFAVYFAGYVTGISWSFGELTFGAPGPINYAFHVNHMPHPVNWQGGTTALGSPIHPTRQVFPDLPVFEFATPFKTTYTPYNDLAYWYQGFHQVRDPRAQIAAIVRSTALLLRIARSHPIVIAVFLALLVPMVRREWRRADWAAAKFCWPMVLPALLGISMYLAVHIEDRYLGAFFLVLGLFAFAPLLDPELRSRQTLAVTLAIIMTIGGLADLLISREDAFVRAVRGADFHNDPQWKLAAAVQAYGLKKDETVAVIRDPRWWPGRSHWAYVSHLRIVAEFGALPYRVEPADRTSINHDQLEPADEDYSLLFWKKLTPARRAQVIDAFRSAGARSIVALSKPEGVEAPGWVPLGDTGSWLYDFRK